MYRHNAGMLKVQKSSCNNLSLHSHTKSQISASNDPSYNIYIYAVHLDKLINMKVGKFQLDD